MMCEVSYVTTLSSTHVGKLELHGALQAQHCSLLFIMEL